MNNILIALNPSKDKSGEILSKVVSQVKNVFNSAKIVVLNSYEISKYKFEEDFDIIIVLGGDGTLLGIARDINERYDIPILGVNIGNLGFLSSIEIQEFDKALNKLKNKDYNIEERLLLKCNTNVDGQDNTNRALNDIVIARGTLSRMAKFKVIVDNKLFNVFKGDGVIISTPTGSTAYSFSAGGPFVYPNVDVITITPICSHTKGMQSIVLNSNSEIEIISEIYNGEIYVTFDGQKAIAINDDTSIKISSARKKAKILLFNDYDYFKVLRKKIINNTEECEGD